MGLPDEWTALDADGKPLADSPRYRMLGNAIARTQSEWIARRMLAVHLRTSRPRPTPPGSPHDLPPR